jgi:uncharacterized protein YggE
LLALVACAVHAGTPLPDAPHIVVSGEGKVSVKPDSVRIRFDFLQRASRPLPAKQSVDAAVNRLLDMLDAYGIGSDDVTASGLSASEDVSYTDDGTRVSNGFVAERNVTVVMGQIDRLNEFLDSGLRSGADEIGNVSFESTEADRLRKEAKRKAVDAAKLKAEEMAVAFGADLGPIYSIDSVNSRFTSGYGSTTLDRIEVTGTRIERGRYIQPTVEYAASVNAVFELRR